MKVKNRILISAIVLATITSCAEDPVEVNLYGDYGNYFDEYSEDISSNINKKISYQPNSWGDHHLALIDNFESGNGLGDLELIDSGMIGGYLNTGDLMDLTAEFAPYKSQMAEFAVVNGQNESGKQMAIPLDLGPGVAFYRRDLMEGIGQDIELVMSSWDSWLEYGRMIKDQYNVPLVSNADGIARAIIYSTVEDGNGVYIGANNEILIENDRFKFAFNLAKTLNDEGLSANTGMWNDDWYDGFNYRNFAMEISGAWLLGHMSGWISPDTSGLWGASNLPNGIFTNWSGTYLVIPSSSTENKNEAWGIIEYMISRSAQLEGFKNWAMFPANTTTYSDPIFDWGIDYLDGQNARALFAQISNDIPAILPSKYDSIAETLVINTALQDVIHSGRDVDEALADAAAQLAQRM